MLIENQVDGARWALRPDQSSLRAALDRWTQAFNESTPGVAGVALFSRP